MTTLNDYKKEYDALPDKKNLTKKEAMKAVKEDNLALAYIHEQTPEICLAAVREDGFALRYVHKQTPEICLAAVKQDSFALRYVHENMFTPPEEMTLEQVCKELGRDVKIIR